MLAAYMDLNPNKDINWILILRAAPLRSQQTPMLRERKISHVLVNRPTMPWSRYFCRMKVVECGTFRSTSSRATRSGSDAQSRLP